MFFIKIILLIGLIFVVVEFFMFFIFGVIVMFEVFFFIVVLLLFSKFFVIDFEIVNSREGVIFEDFIINLFSEYEVFLELE